MVFHQVELHSTEEAQREHAPFNFCSPQGKTGAMLLLLLCQRPINSRVSAPNTISQTLRPCTGSSPASSRIALSHLWGAHSELCFHMPSLGSRPAQTGPHPLSPLTAILVLARPVEVDEKTTPVHPDPIQQWIEESVHAQDSAGAAITSTACPGSLHLCLRLALKVTGTAVCRGITCTAASSSGTCSKFGDGTDSVSWLVWLLLSSPE